ncbi:MAG TPA: sulfite exporter TauE/SafE family protein [Terriglobales bacterium]|nr:sulfite exporter TauE/SafE family protein [Terriglobales bacterium]
MIEVLIGLGGGLLIGSTGIGSGSLIAPLLILAGYSPATAVGAGLVSLVVSKLTATELHRQMGHLPGRRALPLVIGGLGGVALTALGTRFVSRWDVQFETIMKLALGVGLLGVAATLLIPRSAGSQLRRASPFTGHPVLLLSLGAGVALVVALTSAGAGGLLIPALLIVTHWEPAELAAVSNFYGTAVGAASILLYVGYHSLNFPLIGLVLIGLLPGVLLGTRLSRRISRPWLTRGAGVVAGYLGCALLCSRF